MKTNGFSARDTITRNVQFKWYTVIFSKQNNRTPCRVFIYETATEHEITEHHSIRYTFNFTTAIILNIFETLCMHEANRTYIRKECKECYAVRHTVVRVEGSLDRVEFEYLTESAWCHYRRMDGMNGRLVGWLCAVCRF